MVNEMMHGGGGGGGSVAAKPLNNFKRLSASLETLISSIAQDWETAATVESAEVTTAGEENRPIHGQLRKAQLLFTGLHSATRQTHVAIEGFRNKVAAAKQSMDLNHLQLENLLYERDHLSRETQLCQDFTMTELHKMEEDEEQGFLEDVDKLQTREEHAQNLSILKDQKDKRTSAQLELEAVKIRVKAANAAVSDSKQYLDKLPDYLKDVEKALVPLRKNMPWRPGARRGRHEQAADLPGPLFTIYCQLEAYCDSVLADEAAREDEASASSLVAYQGDGGEQAFAVSVSLVSAKVYVSASAKAAAEGPDEYVDATDGDSRAGPGSSPERPGGDTAKRQRRHYRQDEEDGTPPGGCEKRKVSRREAGRSMRDALKSSKTEVLLTMTNPFADRGAGDASNGKGKGGGKQGGSFSVRFSFLPALAIVAVSPQPGAPPSLLANLFPNDTGKDTPNPANHHGRAARASVSGVFEYPADVPCRPYRWAQWLAGLHFPPPASGGASAPATIGEDGGAGPIEPSTRAVVAALRSRVRTQVALAAQLRSFSAKGPLPLSAFQEDLPEATGNVELRSWKELSGSELQLVAKAFEERGASNAAAVQGAAAGGSGSPSSRKEWERYGARYFKGVVNMKKGRGKERNIELQVEVPAEYPLRPSLVRLSESGNAAVREELRAISNEVNAHYDTLLTEDVTRWDDLLSNQLSLAMECLVVRPVGDFGRLRRGRMRRKPVLFDRLERTFVHR